MHFLLIRDSTAAIRWTLCFLSVQTIQVCLESLYNHRLYDNAHLLSWMFLRGNRKFFRYGSAAGKVFHALFRYPNFLFLVLLRLLLALLIIIAIFVQKDYSFFIFPIVFVNLLTGMRNVYGDNGSDQLSNIIWINIVIAYLAGNAAFARNIVVFFIACQGSLAYATAGYYKLFSRKWLNGDHLKNVMATATFGNKYLKKIADRWPASYGWMSLGTIGLEVLLSLAFLCPPPICLLILAAGFLFHFSLAVVMGFNTFVWAFPATYPSIYLIAFKLHQGS